MQTNNLPLICVCHTASADPHRAAMIKNSHAISGSGVHRNRIMTQMMLRTAPPMKIGTLPTYLMKLPNVAEKQASIKP